MFTLQNVDYVNYVQKLVSSLKKYEQNYKHAPLQSTRDSVRCPGHKRTTHLTPFHPPPHPAYPLPPTAFPIQPPDRPRSLHIHLPATTHAPITHPFPRPFPSNHPQRINPFFRLIAFVSALTSRSSPLSPSPLDANGASPLNQRVYGLQRCPPFQELQESRREYGSCHQSQSSHEEPHRLPCHQSL